MSILLRDPFVRELIYNDLERERGMRPYRHPIRVHRIVDSPLHLAPQSFDHALSELQSVMDNVNEVIGNFHTGLTKDMGVGEMKTTRTENGNIQVAIDCSQYKPEEINVKVCDDNLVVSAKTETSEQDSYHKSEFKRWVKLPADVKQEAIKSTLTPDRKLLIEVPVNKPIADSRSRSIPIDVQKEDPKKVTAGDKQQQNNQAK